ncbi:protease FtsH-inhibitory lysogeny factor CIII [Erwinia sp. JH02]|nr:protease FtsH-inhibitory lysogeny factor CIII [Erwinia sp. JH02]NNS07294.1 protease FtsH-inhibitory lysogeny factor CIII [Erwinia sp. JH02]
MQLVIAGWPVAGRSESLLDVITRRLRSGWRSLIEMLNQRGEP